ncbi:MAG: hypothetical protein QOD93_4498 [Acetobacteraceae bacterium]|jgi:hypothetical protein|nr:hypothetical protein [Acetobacteraceae bacterium]
MTGGRVGPGTIQDMAKVPQGRCEAVRPCWPPLVRRRQETTVRSQNRGLRSL